MGTDDKKAVDENTRTLIRIEARRLVGKFGFSQSDRDDLEQDLALHLIEHADQFDSSRACWRTFVNRMVDNRIISIMRRRLAQRRDYRRTMLLSELTVDDRGDSLEPACDSGAHIDPSPDLAIDLDDAIQKLDCPTQRMCRLLAHESLAESARRLGLTRAQMRTQVSRIRNLLTEQGMEDYLKS